MSEFGFAGPFELLKRIKAGVLFDPIRSSYFLNYMQAILSQLAEVLMWFEHWLRILLIIWSGPRGIKITLGLSKSCSEGSSKARTELMSSLGMSIWRLRNGTTRLISSSLSMLTFVEQILSCLIMVSPRVTSTNIESERKSLVFGNTFSAFMIHS